MSIDKMHIDNYTLAGSDGCFAVSIKGKLWRCPPLPVGDAVILKEKPNANCHFGRHQ